MEHRRAQFSGRATTSPDLPTLPRELLMKERRQASVAVLREAHPGYIMPVGVWQVRENVRNAMQQKPLKYNTLQEALARIGSQFQIPISKWTQQSQLLQNALFQKRITDYLKSS